MSDYHKKLVILTLVTRGNNYTEKKVKREYRVVLAEITGKAEDLSSGDLAEIFRDTYAVKDAKIAEGVAIEKLWQFQKGGRIPVPGSNEEIVQPVRITLDYSVVTIGTLFKDFSTVNKPTATKRSYSRAERRRSYNGAKRYAQ